MRISRVGSFEPCSVGTGLGIVNLGSAFGCVCFGAGIRPLRAKVVKAPKSPPAQGRRSVAPMCSGLTFALAEVSFHLAGPGAERPRKVLPSSLVELGVTQNR